LLSHCNGAGGHRSRALVVEEPDRRDPVDRGRVGGGPVRQAPRRRLAVAAGHGAGDAPSREELDANDSGSATS